MEKKSRVLLFLALLGMGMAFGLILHVFLMPFLETLIHCVAIGAVFGLINFLVADVFAQKIQTLKEANRVLRKKAHRDGLTGLLNRKAFNEDLLRISRSQTLVSALYLDIDDFKSYNDRFGHEVGDLVLKEVAKTVKDTLRHSDHVYRLGGDEIVALLPNCDKANAQIAADKISSAIKLIDMGGYPRISVSIGISSYPEDADTVRGIINRADEAMYLEKQRA